MFTLAFVLNLHHKAWYLKTYGPAPVPRPLHYHHHPNSSNCVSAALSKFDLMVNVEKCLLWC